MIYYFSGTGNSREVAMRLAKSTNDEAQHICNEAIHTTSCPDRVVGFVFPVYGWTIPPVMTSFIKQLRITHATPYIYMVCTCGDDIGLTDLVFHRILEAKQLSCQATWSIQMPDTYIGLPGFNIDSEEEIQRKLHLAWVRTESIAQHVSEGCSHIHDVVNGKCAWLKTHLLGRIFHRFLTGDHQFRVDHRCTHCGRCQKVCPMQNITYDADGLPQWKGRCADCLSCYHHCPHNAIQYGKFSKGKGQYQIPSEETSIISFNNHLNTHTL